MQRNRWSSIFLAIVFAVVVCTAASFLANRLFDAPVGRTLATAIPIACAVGAVEFMSRRGRKRTESDADGMR